ncbi:TPA: TIR domain-containing protein [Klebsiella pneumoniae]|nr:MULTISPECIES: toll/interleukin-1 receptor domain-containing protein [Klebsiella]EIX9510450.1 TIR domain-containing protein [Klebsiella pneumoniae]EKZ5840920.1 TIR domain-containing protein [Klebsiella pneumoniae]ELA1575816.1 TIR domain-containing protein [Klebsiella pneumoniae]ELA3325175.1 TIR domain-containing protein [Klebsiella pneumoniae]ELI7029051.1 TIR domain-containing protein [Klebsiella pneumoniae]
MSKAFLSHSWADKEFVRSVAIDLGRQYCVFDEQMFDNAESFKDSIENFLLDTSIFVLFASKASLKSIWVDFEIKEARYQVLLKNIQKAVVFIIDSDIKPEDLPAWLNRAKISSTNIPKLVSREIRTHIDKVLMMTQKSYFEGRSADLEKFQIMMTPIGLPAPKISSIYGLPHIGRRTFLSHAASLTLAFNRLLPISVSDGDELVDITVKFSTQLEPYSTKEGFEFLIDTIRRESEEQLVERILSLLITAVANKELPVLIDDGGLFTSDGYHKQSVRTILKNITSRGEIYLFVISNRKSNEIENSLQLAPLSQDHIKRLLSKVAVDTKIVLTAPQITELSEYVNGFPPSVYYAVQLLKEYGVDAVLSDKNRLVQFRTSFFVDFLNKYFFDSIDKQVLSFLGKYSPVSINIIVEVLKLDVKQVTASIIKLIENSLVVLNDRSLYYISEPILDAVNNLFREEKGVDHLATYHSLKLYLASQNEELPRLELMRLLFRAAARSGQPIGEIFHMSNDLIRLAEDYYHQRDYKQCIRFAELSLEEVSDNENAKELLIRSYIQDEQWELAMDNINSYSKYAVKRNVSFLLGFYHRKRGELPDAINSFHDAERSGHRGVAVKRELAMCYYLYNKMAEAKRYVLEAMSRNETKYLIDLYIQIFTREGDEIKAREGLLKLEKMDTVSFVQHRLSTVELRFGNVPAALNAAKYALESAKGERPPFGILSQLVTCYTRAGKFEEAEGILSRLSRQFDNKKNDIRLGLECRLEIEKGRYSVALKIISRIKNKELLVYKTMERDALVGELKVSALSDQLRIEYSKTVSLLNSELDNKDVLNSWMELII